MTGAGMQRMIEKAFFALLCFEINGEELEDELNNLITPEILPALFKLAKRHDLAHLIGDALDKNGLLEEGSEAQKRFLRERNMAVYRYEQIQYEFEQICELIKSKCIPLDLPSTLYEYNNTFFLVLKPSPKIHLLILEFGEMVKDLDTAEGFLEEHGKKIINNSALNTINENFIKA